MLDAQMVSVDAVDEYGNTVLIVAAQNNNKKIVKVMARMPTTLNRCAYCAPHSNELRRLFCGVERIPPLLLTNPPPLLYECTC
jgi:ankyrin repeat protein